MYSKAKNTSVHFTYLDSYEMDSVRNHVEIAKKDLKPGKWFYLRAPPFYLEKILPKLTNKLREYSKLRRGFTSGANDFFYLNDITHLYDTDYLTNRERLEEMGIRMTNSRELIHQDLVYIENERGERFVIDRKDTIPIIRSPKQLGSYQIAKQTTLCLFTRSPGKFTLIYIKHGEDLGLQKRPTIVNHNPWYKLADLTPAHILLVKSPIETFYVPISETPLICDQRLYLLNTKSPEKMWIYLNSTIALLTIQLYSRKGSSSSRGSVMDAAVEDYEEMPVPSLDSLTIEYDTTIQLRRKALKYKDEIKQIDRKELDKSVLKALGFDKPENVLHELYEAFVEVVEDRLIKTDESIDSSEGKKTSVEEVN